MNKVLKLSKQTIPTFLELYKNSGYPKHAVTCSALKNLMIQSEKFREINDSLELHTLSDDWQKDGLFLLKNERSYYFDSLELQPFDRLKKLLLTIDYSNKIVFQAIRDQFKTLINEVLWLKNLEIIDQIGTTVYFLPKECVRKLRQPTIPEGWQFRRLTLNDVVEINQKLIREGGDNLNYVENSIKYKLSLGLFNENGKLQAWLFGVDVGTQGSLGVTDDHQNKGAACAIIVKFSQMLLKKHDCDTIFNVAHGNDKMHRLAAKLNSNPTDTVTWMAVNTRMTKKMTQMGMYQIFYPKL